MCLDGKINEAGMWNGTERTDGDVMNLLLTCKDVYSECVDNAYMQNTFSFSDFYSFNVFYGATLPDRFNRIQHLHVAQTYKWDSNHAFKLGQKCTACLTDHVVEENWAPRDEYTWQATWNIIAHMPNLKTLDVLLYWEHSHLYPGWEGTPAELQELNILEQKLFALMANVRVDGLQFEVRVNWPGGLYLSPWPFKVIRDLTQFDYLVVASREFSANQAMFVYSMMPLPMI